MIHFDTTRKHWVNLHLFFPLEVEDCIAVLVLHLSDVEFGDRKVASILKVTLSKPKLIFMECH